MEILCEIAWYFGFFGKVVQFHGIFVKKLNKFNYFILKLGNFMWNHMTLVYKASQIWFGHSWTLELVEVTSKINEPWHLNSPPADYLLAS